MLKTAEYLAALNPGACENYCRIKGIDFLEVNPFSFSALEEVVDCMSTFIAEGISLAYVFQCADVWSIYMKGVSDEKYHKALDLVLHYGGPTDFMYYIRGCYRMGFPAISNEEYDALERLYLDTFPSLSFFREQTDDDDIYPEIVKEAIRMSGVKSTGKSGAKAISKLNLTSNARYDDLNTEKSTSIRPVVDPSEAYNFWCSAPVCRVHFSLKIDGVNTKIASSEEHGMELALSRGRSTDSIDYSEAIQTFLQLKGIDVRKVPGRITGESFVGVENLKTVVTHYPDKNYKTPKSTAMAMLRAPHNFIREDLQYLTFCAFDYNGFKPDESFRMLQEVGFDTPPALEFDGEEIPRSSIAEFNEWMNHNVLDPLYERGNELGIGSDGVVMYLLADIDAERNDKYSNCNIAIKYGHWAAATYVSRVTGILFEQRRVEASIVLEIEPCLTRDMNTATRVGVGSPDILIRDGIQMGDEIVFERKSEAYNVYLRKKE